MTLDINIAKSIYMLIIYALILKIIQHAINIKLIIGYNNNIFFKALLFFCGFNDEILWLVISELIFKDFVLVKKSIDHNNFFDIYCIDD